MMMMMMMVMVVQQQTTSRNDLIVQLAFNSVLNRLTSIKLTLNPCDGTAHCH